MYYIASIPVGMMWIWAVFLDIKDMKGKVGLLKEELQLVIKSNTSEKTKDIRVLLENLEGVSHGNLDVYKMRIREILNMLTDTTIEAGGDTDSLLQRNVDKTKAIQHSKDATQVKEIIYNEAVELSEMISDIPQQKNALAVNKVVDYLKGNFSEDISVDEIARMAGLSKAHLMREFKKNIGQTILQYQTKLRIEASQHLLIDQTVTETAYQVGYNNPNYFSTVFRKVTGFSPIEFQEKNRNTTL
ncbi:helix-turn-helix transcriptional regulator [Flammeovirga sp. MY04]|uniref:AraC family transcriptional regulator n=1 Tax=Flammeovirga sp. MY04 TaxID=1191459 RepID=UPI00082570AE|nr:helix-turn-helix domain-containing protein [Flammeovirga sp. MY04]QJD09379.1 helix-turn-helix transcriptional regulator [Flammeovirga sp. MY04]